MAFLHKEVPFDLVQVDLSSKPSWFRQVNGRGLVPAVQWKDQTVVESIDIVRWLDSEFPGGCSLTPVDGVTRRLMDDIINGAMPGVVSAGLGAVAGSTSHSWGIGSGATASQLRRLEGSLQPLSDALKKSGGPYLAGSSLSAADVIAFPFIERFDLALRMFHGYDMALFDGGSIFQWLATVRELRAAQMACAAEGKLARAFQEHRSLDWFDYITVDIGDLHPQLLQ